MIGGIKSEIQRMNEAAQGTKNLLDSQIQHFETYKHEEVIWRDEIQHKNKENFLALSSNCRELQEEINGLKEKMSKQDTKIFEVKNTNDAFEIRIEANK